MKPPPITQSCIPLIDRAFAYGTATALIDDVGGHTYKKLTSSTPRLAMAILGESQDLHGARVAYLLPPGFDHVVMQWAIWSAGGVAVPLCPRHAPEEWKDRIVRSGASFVISGEAERAVLEELCGRATVPYFSTEKLRSKAPLKLPFVAADRPALMLFAEGLAGEKEVVVTTHDAIAGRIMGLVEAHGWTAMDRALNLIPLHEEHGIIGATGCALWSGASCEVTSQFNADAVWDAIITGSITVLVAGPNDYDSLAQAWAQENAARRKTMTSACQRVRMMIPIASATPAKIREQWLNISGGELREF